MLRHKKKPDAPNTWGDWKARLSKLYQDAQPATFEDVLEEGDELTFMYRVLPPKRLDAIRKQAMRIRNKRGKPDLDYDQGREKTLTLLDGLVDGPEGWETTEGNVDLLPEHVREDLNRLIRGGRELEDEEETNEAFHSFREGTQGEHPTD